MENSREFKAVIQDMTHVYLGAQMSARELTIYEDVPCKIKAIVNKYFYSEEIADRKIADIVSDISKDDFRYQVLKQLRIKFKVGIYNEKKAYKSKTLTLDEFLDIHSSEKEVFDEELVFNKLALLAFST